MRLRYLVLGMMKAEAIEHREFSNRGSIVAPLAGIVYGFAVQVCLYCMWKLHLINHWTVAECSSPGAHFCQHTW